MSKVTVEDNTLYGIGAAIRNKNGEETLYKPSQMASAIGRIETYPEPTGSISITENGTTNVKDYASAVVNVPNSYGASDEGKVVSSGALVSQTSTDVTANGTYDTTTNNEVVVEVENSYSASDEGKVVSGGTLISQGSQTITENGTYDTTEISSLIANVAGGGGGATILTGIDAPTASIGNDGDIYLLHTSDALTNIGASYIDTGYICKSDTKIVCKCKIAGGERFYSPFGVRNAASATAQGFYLMRDSSDVFYIVFGSEMIEVSGMQASSVIDKNVTITLEPNSFSITGDGIDRSITFSSGTPDAVNTLYIFTMNEAGVALSNRYCYMDLYAFKIYESNVLVHDFTPADNSGSPSLYDDVDGSYIDCTGNTVTYNDSKTIISAYLKVNGAWQNLIGSDINDVTT